MTPYALIKQFCGKSRSARSIVLVGFAFIGMFLTSVGCRPHGRPKWAEEYYPDYERVKTGYREISFEVESVLTKTNARPTSFAALAGAIRNRFPTTEIDLEGKNPFPAILPRDREYLRLVSWNGVTNESVPIVWSTVQLREPAILYIGKEGEIKTETLMAFESILKSCVSAGALVFTNR